jgi:hypothetical protein
MTERPDSHAFPATKLGAFLRAMEDPEGAGKIDPERAREIEKIEERVAKSQRSDADDQ